MFCKICGLTRQTDINMANELGAKMCGFIFHPQSPRAIAPSHVATFDTGAMLRIGVFVKQNADEIIQIMHEARLDFAQLHGKQSIECAQRIDKKKVIRVLWPEAYKTEQDFQNALDLYANNCAYYLFDAGTQGGGSGKTINLHTIATMQSKKLFKNPWILAGGLNAQTIQQALEICTPSGFDCNSAIESEAGIKDHKYMEKVFYTIKHHQQETI